MKPTNKPETYTALLVDDEQVAVDHLAELLKQFPRINIVAKTTSSNEVIDLVNTHAPDLLFLDIQMPGKNGLEILKEISFLEKPPKVIMVTAYDQFVLDALRNCAYDYILKPCDQDELARLIGRLDHIDSAADEKKNIGRLLSALSHKIQVKGVYEDYYFNPSEILFLEAEGKYTRFHLLSQKPVLSSINLSHFEKELSRDTFKRISKSFLINTAFLYKLDKKKKVVVLKTGTNEIELTYSGVYLDSLKK